MTDRSNPHLRSAYGGPGWQPRTQSLTDELGSLWADCGANSEYAPLDRVLLHRPGPELAASDDPASVQMLESLDIELAQTQHDNLASCYQNNSVNVSYVEPRQARPNQMFLADLMFMTPQGVILARPASTVRAGEEVEVSAALGRLNIPVLGSVHGHGIFEGADAIWITPDKVMLGRGLRSNQEGLRQVALLLDSIGVETIVTDMPIGTMHLMGQLRILDQNLALAWPTRLAIRAVECLRYVGMEVAMLPDEQEALSGYALNMVTLAPRKVMMCRGNTATIKLLQSHGVECIEVEMSELGKAAGSIGCLTAILKRRLV
ncbi:MAG: arginine deiminase [Parasphingorhabdus sp.]|jgi:arginine deiminase